MISLKDKVIKLKFNTKTWLKSIKTDIVISKPILMKLMNSVWEDWPVILSIACLRVILDL
jgi:hypothetical protein